MELDLHVHSGFSFDSRLAPADIIEVAMEEGLDGVAVCDHNTCEGALATRELAPPGFLVVCGIELGCKVVGDVLGLFVENPGDELLKTAVQSREITDFIEAVKAQNGLLVLAHPTDVGMMYLEAEKLIARFDGVETFNSRRASVPSVEAGDGEPHLADYAKRHRLAVTAGSDAHAASEIGRARTLVPARGADGLRIAFKQRSTLVHGRRTNFGAKLMSQIVRFLGIGGKRKL